MRKAKAAVVFAFLGTMAAGCGDDGDDGEHGEDRGRESTVDPVGPSGQSLNREQKLCVEAAYMICERRLECTAEFTGGRIDAATADRYLEECTLAMANGPLRCAQVKQVTSALDSCFDDLSDARCLYERQASSTKVDVAIPASCQGVFRS